MVGDRPYKTVLTIAGSDPSGGAGLQADLKCFAALSVHGCSVVTAITAQNTAEVRTVYPLPAPQVKEQLDAIYDDFEIAAVKTGMLHDSSIVDLVADRIALERTKLIVDPVLHSTAGPALSKADLVQALKDRLVPKAFLITPNIPEAAELTDAPIRGEDGMRRACQELYQMGCEHVLIKGGHLAKGPAKDLFYDGTFRTFEGPRFPRKVHGTGCMLSAYITAIVAKGIPVADAIELSKKYVTETIRFASELGKGALVGNPLTNLHNSAQRYHVISEVERASITLEEILPSSFLPDAGINLCFALPCAAGPDEVCAIEGRLVRVGQKVRRVALPRFGASQNTAAVTLAVLEKDRRFRCVMNLRYSKILLEVCRVLGLKTAPVDRRKVHKDSDSHAPGITETLQVLGFVPDILWDDNTPGREPQVWVLGEYPSQVIDKVKKLVNELKEHH